jgi:FkbM family methyltransferase
MRRSILSAGIFLKRHFLDGPQERTQREWVMKNGDLTLRITYDFLTGESIVFDLGGYRGQWASDIYSKYGSNIYVFEPVPQYAEFIRERFRYNQKIRCFEFGLGSRSEDKLIKVSEDSSSTYAKGANTCIRMQDFAAFVNHAGVTKIDLMKVNIEGGEYDILPYLIRTRCVEQIRALQIQFHAFAKDHMQRANEIRLELERTHVCDFCSEFVWEGWTRRGN